MKKIAAALVLLLLSGIAAFGASIEDIDAAVDANREEQITTTQDIIKIESFNQITDGYTGPYPAEGVEKSLIFMFDKAKAMGFKTVLHQWNGAENVRGPLYGYVEFGPEDAPEMIMSLAHLDTVPPGNPDLWTLGGAYEAKIADRNGAQHIVGRGAFDDKGPAMASLYALKAIKDSGVSIDRRIRLFFGTTEDYGGWICTDAYAADAAAGKEEWPVLGFSPDSGSFRPTYIEKTSVNVAASNAIDPAAAKVKLTFLYGGTANNAVSDNCKAVLEGSPADLAAVRASMVKAIAEQGWDLTALPILISDGSDGKLTVNVTGRAAHSGQAWAGIGANNRMMYLLAKAATGEDWEVIAGKISSLLPPDEDAASMGAALGVHEGDVVEYDNVSVNMGWARLEENPEGSGKPAIYIHVNIRYAGTGADALVPGVSHQSGQVIKDKVGAKFTEAGLAHTLTGGGEPYTAPVDSEIMVKLQQAYKDITSADAAPCITYGGTYASAWSGEKLSADTEEVFGVRMVAWGMDGGIGMHEANESMGVEKLIEGTKIMARAMVYLATAAPAAPEASVPFDDLGPTPPPAEPAPNYGEHPWLAAILLVIICAVLWKYNKPKA